MGLGTAQGGPRNSGDGAGLSAEAGVIPRAIHQIFSTLDANDAEYTGAPGQPASWQTASLADRRQRRWQPWCSHAGCGAVEQPAGLRVAVFLPQFFSHLVSLDANLSRSAWPGNARWRVASWGLLGTQGRAEAQLRVSCKEARRRGWCRRMPGRARNTCVGAG